MNEVSHIFKKGILYRKVELKEVKKRPAKILEKGTELFVTRETNKGYLVRLNPKDPVEYPVSKSALKIVRIFKEVKNDYTDPDSGNICIDAFKTLKGDEEGSVVAQVTPDGKVIIGENAHEKDLRCEVVINSIKEALGLQEGFKQALVDKVIDDLKSDFESGDYTVLDELLKFIPCKNLMLSLKNEEEYRDYPSDFVK